MVLDTSVVIAIVANEPERENFLQAIASADICYIPSICIYEACVVLAGRKFADPAEAVFGLIATLNVQVHPFQLQDAQLAYEAYREWGKGFHPAALNFGDCPAYAAAKGYGVPLLYKGDDFSRTDVTSALA